MSTKLRVGDTVKVYGYEAEVLHNYHSSMEEYPLRVKIPTEESGDMILSFTTGGFIHKWHKTPGVTLVRRAAIKKTFWQWVNNRSGVVTPYLDEEMKSPQGIKAKLMDKYSKLEHTAREFEVNCDC